MTSLNWNFCINHLRLSWSLKQISIWGEQFLVWCETVRTINETLVNKNNKSMQKIHHCHNATTSRTEYIKVAGTSRALRSLAKGGGGGVAELLVMNIWLTTLYIISWITMPLFSWLELTNRSEKLKLSQLTLVVLGMTSFLTKKCMRGLLHAWYWIWGTQLIYNNSYSTGCPWGYPILYFPIAQQLLYS